jgi:cytochrome c
MRFIRDGATMKKVAWLFVTGGMAITCLGFPAERGTPAEAKAMLEKAVAHYKSAGRKQALADFNSKKAPFYDRDLYVVCFDASRTILANGGFPQYVGYSADMIRDIHGNSVGRQGWEIAHKNGQGEVRYDWINPMTHKAEPKITFFAAAGDDVCGVGAYNPK